MAYVFIFNLVKQKLKIPDGYDLLELQNETFGRPTVGLIKENELIAKKTLLSQDMEDTERVQSWIDAVVTKPYSDLKYNRKQEVSEWVDSAVKKHSEPKPDKIFKHVKF